MKEIPKYILKALEKRAKAAVAFSEADSIISEYIDNNEIDCEYTHLHVEALTNPYSCNEETIQDIKKHMEEKNEHF
jgi:hypothetical protein